MWIAIGAAVVLLAAYLVMVFPAPARRRVREIFANRSYAHRGLHDNASGPPENSLAAFSAAVENGYGMELDVQLTKDKQLVVFHDLTLLRVCGVDKRVRDLTYEEIRELRLLDSDEKIPLFTEMLAVVDGKQPLIVELKSDGEKLWSDETCRITYSILKDYKGDYCIESFDPFMVRWFALCAAGITRGQLSMGMKGYGKQVTAINRFLVSRLFSNVLNRPHFIAYKYDDRNLSLRIAKLLGAMSFMWTVKEPEEQERLQKTEDGIIFEGYCPPPKW